jgi:hypothetical protein
MGKRKKKRKKWKPIGLPRSENAWTRELRDYERRLTQPMSTMEPPDADDEFKRLMEGLELEAPINVEDVSLLTEVELSSRFNKVRQDLLARGEMIDPKTDTGREMHSQRTAYMLEMRRRGMA